jgi:uncharacterized membrane protein
MDSVRKLRWKTLVFALVVVFSNAVGNTSLTWGLKHGAEPLTSSPLSYISAIFTPWVAAGIVLLIVWLLTRMAFLSFADLSYVLPVTALGYVASAMLGHYFLSETISPARWAGTLLICAGTVLVGLGKPSGETA